MATYDLLQPIADNNRDEVFLIEYEGFIRNTAEGLIRSLQLNITENLQKYPKLSEYNDLTPDELYHKVMYYAGEQLLDILCENNKSIPEIISLYQSIMEPNDIISYLHDTIYYRMLMNLSEKKFMKSIHIIKHTKYTPTDISMFNNDFHENSNKLHIYNGDTVHFYMAHPEITTVMLNDTVDLDNLLSHADKEHLKNTLFILRNNVDTLHQSPTDSSVIMYKNGEYYKSIIDKKITAIIHTDVECIPQDPNSREIDPTNVG